jgi:hypothetical protein
MRTYVEEGGKYAAAQGCNDDRVITAAIASQLMVLLPRQTYTGASGAPKAVGFSNWKPESSGDKSDYMEIYA